MSGNTSPLELGLGLASLQRDAAAGAKLPPVDKWHPTHCGDIDIRIARDGTWYHEGTPVGRKELVRLFSTILRRDPDGFVLVTPGEKMRIVVEDAPFLAVLLDVEESYPPLEGGSKSQSDFGEGSGSERNQNLIFTTNVGDQVTANAENPIRVETNPDTEEPAPYVHVRKGLEARIARAVFYQLADLAVPGEGEHLGFLGVWSGGVFFRLGRPA
ncbi:MAG TPA: DUF1285 domain-containing protein [Rhizomicrobium sp.]|jgi:hypothetical protein|nr:DUF1285 domain-containing protein [Rhizomicrobium sp.]